MVDTVEPVVGRTALDQAHRQIHIDLLNSLSWIPSGYTPSAGAGLTLDIAAGRAFLGGASVDRDVAGTETMVDATTNYVFIYIDDILNDGVVYFHVDQDDTAPTQGPSHKIATVTTSGGSITLVTDERRTVPEISDGLSLGGALELGGSVISKGNANIDLDPAGTGLVAINSHFRSFSDGAHDLGRPSFDWRDIYARELHLNEDVVLSVGAAGRLDLASGKNFNLIAGDILLAAGRLVDGIDPSDHSGRHDAGGADTLVVDAAAGTGSLRTLGTGTQQAGQGSVLADHNARHEPGGADPMAVDQAVGVASLRTLGLGAAQAAQGSVFDDHSARHEEGGADVLAIDAAAGVGSLRRLGNISTRAAAGDHSHAFSKTRFLPATEAYLTGGSATLEFINASSPRFKAWALDQFSLEKIAWAFEIAQDWDGTSTHNLRIYWTVIGTIGSVCRITRGYTPVADGEALDAAVQTSLGNSNLTARPEYELEVTNVGIIAASNFSKLDIVEFEFTRDGAHANDTFQGDMFILGLEIAYVADHQ